MVSLLPNIISLVDYCDSAESDMAAFNFNVSFPSITPSFLLLPLLLLLLLLLPVFLLVLLLLVLPLLLLLPYPNDCISGSWSSLCIKSKAIKVKKT